MASLGFDHLVAILVPGVTLSLAAWLLAVQWLPVGPIRTAIEDLATTEWRFTFVSLVAALFFGACMRSLAGLIEAKIIDSRTRRRLGQSEAQYDRVWDLYVDSLRTDKNTYVSDL